MTYYSRSNRTLNPHTYTVSLNSRRERDDCDCDHHAEGGYDHAKRSDDHCCGIKCKYIQPYHLVLPRGQHPYMYTQNNTGMLLLFVCLNKSYPVTWNVC